MRQKQKNTQKDLLFILVSSFIVVVAWVSFNIYHIWVTSTVSPDVQSELAPIDPIFDPQTIEQLKTRENIKPLFQSQQSNSPLSPTPTQLKGTPAPTSDPAVTPSQSATNTSQLTPSNQPINRLGQ